MKQKQPLQKTNFDTFDHLWLVFIGLILTIAMMTYKKNQNVKYSRAYSKSAPLKKIT